MRNKFMFGILIFSLLVSVGCSTINSESQATVKAESYAEELWMKAQTDPRNCIKPPCEIKEHQTRTKYVIPMSDYWIVNVEVEHYNPKLDTISKNESEPEFIREIAQQAIYMKTYFDIKVLNTGRLSCLKATYPLSLFTPCIDKGQS